MSPKDIRLIRGYRRARYPFHFRLTSRRSLRYPYRYETEDGNEVLVAYNLTSLASLDVDVIKRRYPFVTRIETQTDHLDWTDQFFVNKNNVYKVGMEKSVGTARWFCNLARSDPR